MVKITECVAKSMHKKKGFKCGKWRTDVRKGKIILSHYGTEMLQINPDRYTAKKAVGFESVSDKQGVNKVLRDLNITGNRVSEIKTNRGHRFD